jgi:hypothetical protein
LKYHKDNKDFRVLGTCRLEISISGPFRKFQKKYEMTKCNLLQEKYFLKQQTSYKEEETYYMRLGSYRLIVLLFPHQYDRRQSSISPPYYKGIQ